LSEQIFIATFYLCYMHAETTSESEHMLTTRVGFGRLTEPKPKTGIFGSKTGTENRVFEKWQNRKPIPKPAVFTKLKTGLFDSKTGVPKTGKTQTGSAGLKPHKSYPIDNPKRISAKIETYPHFILT
jgi:hypothetical protein